MRYLFIISGFGYGHITRCEAVINEIKKRDRNARIMVAGYGNSYDYFKNKFKTVKISKVYFLGANFTINSISSFASNLSLVFRWYRDYYKLKKIIENFNPAAIVSDFEVIGIRAGKNVIGIYDHDYSLVKKFKDRKLKIQRMVMNWLYSAAENNAKLILIPNFKKKENYGKYIFTDLVVRDKPNELESEAKLMKKLNLKRKPIVVMLGGSKFGKELGSSIIGVADSFDEDFIIFGYNEAYTSFRKNIRSYSFNPDFLEYLKVSKGVITLAGHSTLSEAIVYKKPTLVFPVNNHIQQLVNAKEVKKLCLVKYLSENDYIKVKYSIQDFLNKIPKMRKKLEKLDIKGDGASRVAGIIFNNAKP